VRLGVGDTFYRTVRNVISTEDDFRTAEEEGVILVDARYRREWAEGISVYDDLEYALNRARKNRSNLGRYVVTMIVPNDGSIEVRQTGRPPHHTIYAKGSRAMALVRGETISAFDEA
jgi:hypothetical protein